MSDETTVPPRVERQIEMLATALLPSNGTPTAEITLVWKPSRNHGEMVVAVKATTKNTARRAETVEWVNETEADGIDATTALLALRDDLAVKVMARLHELTVTLAECGVGKGE